MKGFKNSTRMSSGFKFPESAGFSSSSGKVQQVRGYTRAVVKKATGGQVPGHVVTKGAYSGAATTIGDQGNSAELRTKPLTEFDKDHGGRGPLRPGFAMGGRVGMSGPLRAAVGAVQKAATGPQTPTAIPRAGMARRPMVGRRFAEGGFLGGLKKGALHKSMGVPAGDKIPAKALSKAAHSSSPLMRKRANFAINARKWNHK